jgi:hypothetical protein
VQCGGITKHAGGRKTSYWSVIHSLTANIGQFGFWRMSDEFVINVQDDSRDDEILVIHLPPWKVTRNERNHCKAILIISTVTALFIYLFL